MSRIRSLHPGLFTDDAYMALSFPARELIKGLWCEADDNGIFVWKPLTIKARIFPADNLDIGELLSELLAGEFVAKFDANSKAYGVVRNFLKFQRPRRPSAIHPLPENAEQYLGGPPAGEQPKQPQDDRAPQESAERPVETGSFPPMSGMSPQMEDVGGRREESNSVPSLRSETAAPLAPPPPVDDKKALYDLGYEVLGANAGGQITKLLKRCDGVIRDARRTLEQAALTANPRAYIGGVLRGERTPDTDWDAWYAAQGMPESEYRVAH